jgi:hypothetical protein
LKSSRRWNRMFLRGPVERNETNPKLGSARASRAPFGALAKRLEKARVLAHFTRWLDAARRRVRHAMARALPIYETARRFNASSAVCFTPLTWAFKVAPAKSVSVRLSLPARNEWGESWREGRLPKKRSSSSLPSPPASLGREGVGHQAPPTHPVQVNIPGTVKICVSSGQAGGFPIRCKASPLPRAITHQLPLHHPDSHD